MYLESMNSVLYSFNWSIIFK